MIKTEYTITTDRLSDNLTITIVADLHQHDPSPVLEILHEVRPDLIAVPGDLFERHAHGENLDRYDKSVLSKIICRGIHFADSLLGLRRFKKHNLKSANSYRFLKEASQIAPIVMCMGNHELYLKEEDQKILAETGAELLDNRYVQYKDILIGGIPSMQCSGEIDESFLREFELAHYNRKKPYKILLCHHPEYYDALSQYDIDLVISGHCHGGQIRIAGHGLFAPGQGILPKYHHGLYDNKSGRGHLVVSSGCANTAAIPRWGNPEEVVVVKIVN